MLKIFAIFHFWQRERRATSPDRCPREIDRIFIHIRAYTCLFLLVSDTRRTEFFLFFFLVMHVYTRSVP
uniref:Uncharacterized protein n=1 Tax=Trichogramma kaykai TaxID=54128 RepID=A0ABD2XJX5_9HYME